MENEQENGNIFRAIPYFPSPRLFQMKGIPLLFAAHITCITKLTELQVPGLRFWPRDPQLGFS